MFNVILIIILVTLSAMFSSCETAYSTVNKMRLKNYASQGSAKAKKALKIANSFDKALTTILIGNNIVNIASTSISTVLFTDLLGSKGVGIATIVMTVTVLIFGEILPKTLAKENAEKFCYMFADPLSFLIIIFTPFVVFFSALKNVVSKLYSSSEKVPSVTEDELKYIIDEIEEEGVLEKSEGNLVRSALDFDETTVSEILIPRVNVVGVEVHMSADEIKDIFLSEMYSRLPVYEKNLDNIIGIITQKDFFKLITQGHDDIQEIIQDVVFISEFKLINDALHEMQRSKTHMSVILDQYGGTKGIITMEDIIEELVGEIYDENDEVEHPFVKISDGIYDVSGELEIDELLTRLNLDPDIAQTDSNTVGGWIMEKAGHIPDINETVSFTCFDMKVLEKDIQKINKVQIILGTDKNLKDTDENKEN
ncbi:MAG: hemolysin family protein [Oscillospiraceae bacterium]|nr:hemolysin family protein [Oscillospiraceae bacterium]